MAERKPWIFTCSGTCWTLGIVAGIMFAGLLNHDLGWGLFAALFVGLIAAVAVAMMLGWAFCHRELGGHAAMLTPVQTPAPAPAPAQKPAVAAAASRTASPAPATVPVAAEPAPEPAPETAAAAEDGRPAALAGARGGAADDLKKIKGVGPKLEALLNEMGFYHFDQIAGWTAAEVAWVDGNLEGFKGRVTRDDWVAQAKLLATGGETEFSRRVDKGGVY